MQMSLLGFSYIKSRFTYKEIKVSLWKKQDCADIVPHFKVTFEEVVSERDWATCLSYICLLDKFRLSQPLPLLVIGMFSGHQTDHTVPLPPLPSNPPLSSNHPGFVSISPTTLHLLSVHLSPHQHPVAILLFGGLNSSMLKHLLALVWV